MQVITRQRFRNGLHLLKQGDVRAQYNVGWMNAYGIGTLQDYEQAVNWYRKSADQGFVHAQFNLGNMYLRGDGVEKDDSLAFTWFIKAAEQGDAASQYNLGRMYVLGKGVAENMAEAKHWIKKAYENNDKNITILAEEVWDKFKLEHLLKKASLQLLKVTTEQDLMLTISASIIATDSAACFNKFILILLLLRMSSTKERISNS